MINGRPALFRVAVQQEITKSRAQFGHILSLPFGHNGFADTACSAKTGDILFAKVETGFEKAIRIFGAAVDNGSV